SDSDITPRHAEPANVARSVISNSRGSRSTGADGYILLVAARANIHSVPGRHAVGGFLHREPGSGLTAVIGIASSFGTIIGGGGKEVRAAKPQHQDCNQLLGHTPIIKCSGGAAGY